MPPSYIVCSQAGGYGKQQNLDDLPVVSHGILQGADKTQLNFWQ